MYNFTSIHSLAKKLYLHMFYIVDTAFSYEKELIVCSFPQEFSKGKESSLQLICNVHTEFYFVGQNFNALLGQNYKNKYQEVTFCKRVNRVFSTTLSMKQRAMIPRRNTQLRHDYIRGRINVCV